MKSSKTSHFCHRAAQVVIKKVCDNTTLQRNETFSAAFPSSAALLIISLSLLRWNLRASLLCCGCRKRKKDFQCHDWIFSPSGACCDLVLTEEIPDAVCSFSETPHRPGQVKNTSIINSCWVHNEVTFNKNPSGKNKRCCRQDRLKVLWLQRSHSKFKNCKPDWPLCKVEQDRSYSLCCWLQPKMTTNHGDDY